MKRGIAAPLLLLVPLLLVAACQSRSVEPATEAMDNNMAAKADEMEALANNRADAMAGDMMTNVAVPDGNGAVAANDTAP